MLCPEASVLVWVATIANFSRSILDAANEVAQHFGMTLTIKHNSCPRLTACSEIFVLSLP